MNWEWFDKKVQETFSISLVKIKGGRGEKRGKEWEREGKDKTKRRETNLLFINNIELMAKGYLKIGNG